MMKNMAILSAAAVLLTAFAIQRYVRIPNSFDFRSSRPSPDETMRAIAYSHHGDVSVLQQVSDYPKPLCKPNQVLVRVYASSINPCDFKFRRNKAPNLIHPKPKIPGEDVAGRIVEVGSKVENFKVGDRIAAMLPLVGSRWGAAADYVAVDASFVAKIGDNTNYTSAAALPLTSLTALQALEQVKKDKDQRILIQAGAGGVGTFAIQYAKHVLGMHVIATASQEKADLLKDLGCDQLIDYRSEHFEDVVQNVDVVFDLMSWSYETRTLSKGSKVLKPNGHYLNVMSSDWGFAGKERANGLASFVNWMYYKIRGGIQYGFVVVEPNGEQLQTVMDLLENSTIRAGVDRQFDLTQVREAYEYLEQGHATGKVVLTHVNNEELQ